MVSGWRLVKSRHAASAFDGEGAKQYGGRWNSPGTLVAYASGSVALATLEVLAHVHSTAILAAYSLVSVRFPKDLLRDLEISKLPSHWRRYPAPPELQAIGDRWVRERRSAALRVPSAIIPSESNYLLNPSHADFKRVIVDPPRPFAFDVRLLRD